MAVTLFDLPAGQEIKQYFDAGRAPSHSGDSNNSEAPPLPSPRPSGQTTSRKLSIVQPSQPSIPISCLPVELLVAALEASLEPTTPNFSSPNPTYISRLTRVVLLASVCRHWLHVIKGTAALWRTVSASDPPCLVKWALGRWTDTSLNVVVDEPWDDVESIDDPIFWRLRCPLQKYSQFLERVSDHRGGWRSADLALPDPSLLRYLPTRPVKTLKTFRLDFTFKGFESSGNAGNEARRDWLVGKFGEVTPRLEHLELGPTVDLTWPAGLLSGLRSLKIRPADGNSSWQNVLEILKHCPQLAHLSICTIGYCTREPVNTANTVHLPSLTSLVVRQSHLSDRLLPCIDAPACVDYTIQTRFFDTLVGDRTTRCAGLCEAEHGEIRANPQARLSDFQSALAKVVRGVEAHDLRFNATFFKPADVVAADPCAAVWVEPPSGERRFRLENWGVRRPGMDAMFDWMHKALREAYSSSEERGPSAEPPNLRLCFSGHVDADTLQKVPQGCRIEAKASELVISDIDAESVKAWLSFLGGGGGGDASEPGCGRRLPNLTHLVLHGAPRAQDVLGMVKARYRGSSSSSTGGSVRRFQVLDLGGGGYMDEDREVWDQVKATVGDGVLR